jgi:hypothetical protein
VLGEGVGNVLAHGHAEEHGLLVRGRGRSRNRGRGRGRGRRSACM